MARHSLTPVNCFVLFLALMSGSTSPLMAEPGENTPGRASDRISVTVNALSRQIAFVKSFSAEFPHQFRQPEGGTTKGVIAVDVKDRRQ